MSEDKSRSFEQKSGSCAGQSLTPHEQIQVILAEYSYREGEKNALAASAMNNLTVLIAILAGLLALIYQVGAAQWWLVIPAFILIFIGIETGRQFSVLYSNMYISLLEKRVNEIAGKKLLLWEHLGSSYHNYIGKLVIRHPSRNRRVINVNAFMLIVYVLVVMFILVFGLVESGKWLASNLPYCRATNITITIVYELAHILFLGLILFSFVQRGELLKLLEDKLRDELFRD